MRKFLWRSAIMTSLGLGIVILLFDLTPLDVWVQDPLFDFVHRRWMIDRDDALLEFLFHRGLRQLLFVLAALALLGLLLSFRISRLAPCRSRLLLFFLAMAIVPAVCGALKQTANIFCPYQVERYGGPDTYVRLLERYPADFRPHDKARCFPAGHASGGFALMVLFFCLSGRRRWYGLGAGLAVGSGMALFQMLRGSHFLSHSLATFLIAWLIILLLRLGLRRSYPDLEPSS